MHLASILRLAPAGYRGLGSVFDDDIPGLPVSVSGMQSSCQHLDTELGLSALLSPRTRINWASEKSAPCEQPLLSSFQYSPEVQKAIESILYIADHIKKEDDDNNVSGARSMLDARRTCS